MLALQGQHGDVRRCPCPPPPPPGPLQHPRLRAARPRLPGVHWGPARCWRLRRAGQTALPRGALGGLWQAWTGELDPNTTQATQGPRCGRKIYTGLAALGKGGKGGQRTVREEGGGGRREEGGREEEGGGAGGRGRSSGARPWGSGSRPGSRGSCRRADRGLAPPRVFPHSSPAALPVSPQRPSPSAGFD